MADIFENMLACQICLEDFQEDGDLLPRILPCSHTLCERCLIKLLGGGGSLQCPECRARHAAPNKEKTFPQNKYLLRDTTAGHQEEIVQGSEGARRGETVQMIVLVDGEKETLN